MIQFQENARTDGRTEERADGRADSPYFIGPFRLPAGVQKKTIKLRQSIKEEKTITNITIDFKLEFPFVAGLYLDQVHFRNRFLELFCEKSSQNSRENTCVCVSFLIKLQAWGPCEFYEMFKNTYFYRTSLVAAFDISYVVTDPFHPSAVFYFNVIQNSAALRN